MHCAEHCSPQWFVTDISVQLAGPTVKAQAASTGCLVVEDSLARRVNSKLSTYDAQHPKIEKNFGI